MAQEIVILPCVYLQAPNGHVYQITVDNSGAIHAQDVGTMPVN